MEPDAHGFPVAGLAEDAPSWLDRVNDFGKAHGGLLTLLGVALSAWAMRRRS